jgi:translation initiation factor IF-3
MTLNKKKSNFKLLLVNRFSPFENVFLIGEGDNVVISKEEALKRAEELNLNLLCVSPKANPPVCKLINYQKYLFELNKKKTKKTTLLNKEVRISLVIEENDLRIKLGKLEEWLNKNFSVKVTLLKKGRVKLTKEDVEKRCHEILEKIKTFSPQIDSKIKIHSQGNKFSFFVNKTKS